MNSTSFLNDCFEIITGNRVLKKTIKAKQQKRNFSVFVFPDNDKQLINCAFRYLSAYCDYHGAKELLIVTTQEVYIPDGPVALKQKCDIRKTVVSSKEMKSILHFCAIFSAPYLCIISLKKPYGRYDHRMIGHKGLRLDDLVCRGLYNLKHVPVQIDGDHITA